MKEKEARLGGVFSAERGYRAGFRVRWDAGRREEEEEAEDDEADDDTIGA